MTYRERKQYRKEHYDKYVHGWILQTCTACNGSGYYDHNGSTECGCCDGTGKERVRGPKSLKED
jgi:hypothetical protein